MRGIMNNIILRRRVNAAIKKGDDREMCRILPDADMHVQARILKTLGGFRASDLAFSALLTYLHAPDMRLREIAALSLGALGNKRAEAHLQHQQKIEANERVMKAVKRAMEELSHD